MAGGGGGAAGRRRVRPLQHHCGQPGFAVPRHHQHAAQPDFARARPRLSGLLSEGGASAAGAYAERLRPCRGPPQEPRARGPAAGPLDTQPRLRRARPERRAQEFRHDRGTDHGPPRRAGDAGPDLFSLGGPTLHPARHAGAGAQGGTHPHRAEHRGHARAVKASAG